MKRTSDRVDPDVFQRFGGAFSGAGWSPYYVCWERQARMRLDHLWVARVEIHVDKGWTSFVRIYFNSASGRRTSPVGEAGFNRLREDLESCGYELRHAPRLPLTLLLKRFRSMGPRLAAVRREVEVRLWPEVPEHRPRSTAQGGISGALRQFLGAPAWAPSGCGWSRRLRLDDGTRVILAILLMQGTKGTRLHPEACVMLEPPKSINRTRMRALTAAVRAAGYRGKVDIARPAGQEPFLFAHFWKDRLGPLGAARERPRLDLLADSLHQLP